MGQVFLDHPDLIQRFYSTNDEGVITGIANRYKRLPELDGIDFLNPYPKMTWEILLNVAL